jgi:orotate phosphoribosyltransferase
VLGAEGHWLVGTLMCRLIERDAPEVAAVGGVSIGADPLVSATSLMSGFGPKPLPGFYIRPEPKAHGTGQLLEGLKQIPRAAQVAILEDVITSGGSLLRAVSRAREAGFEVARAFVLVDRDEGGREVVEREVPVTALFTRGDFP